jgi:hypothetical protein
MTLGVSEGNLEMIGEVLVICRRELVKEFF